jgi:hypothetical protein
MADRRILMMDRKEYMDADSLTDGEYDGRKGGDLHAAYFSQYVNQWHIDCVLREFGADALLASRDYNLNDVPLAKWDRLPMTAHIAAKAKEYGDNTSLATKVCVYKQAARQWLAANGGPKLYPARYRYPATNGDPVRWIRSYAVGHSPDEALENWRAVNRTAVCHELEGPAA